MRIRALVTVIGLATALTLPAAAAAASGGGVSPVQTPVARQHGGPQNAPENGSTSATIRKQGGQKPKVAAKPRATRTTSRPLLIFVQPSFVPRIDSGIGATDSCASYTGCTDEEYCIVWGVRCELVPLPVGTLDPRRLAAP